MKQKNKNKSIKKSYNQPRLEELGNVSGLTKGSGGSEADSGSLTQANILHPPSIPGNS